MRYLEEQKSIMVEKRTDNGKKRAEARKGKNKDLPCMTKSILLKYEKFIIGYEKERKKDNGNFRKGAF